MRLLVLVGALPGAMFAFATANGTQLRTVLGTFGSGGCVRQPDYKAKALFDWAPIGTPVHVFP